MEKIMWHVKAAALCFGLSACLVSLFALLAWFGVQMTKHFS